MNLFKGSMILHACLFLATLIWRTEGLIKCWSCLNLPKCRQPENVKLKEFSPQTEWCCISESWRVPKDGGEPHIYSLWKYPSNPNDQKKFGMTLGCKRSTKHNEDGDIIKLAKCCCNTDGCNKELNISVLEGPDGVVNSGSRKRVFSTGLILISSFLTLPRPISLLLLCGFVLLPNTKEYPTNMNAITEAEFPKNLASFLISPISEPIVYAETRLTTGSFDILSKELLNSVEVQDEPKGKIVHIPTSSVSKKYERNKGILTPMMNCPEDWFVRELLVSF